MKQALVITIIVGLLMAGFAEGQGQGLSGDSGVVEQKGRTLPPDLTFRDEQGSPVTLEDLTTRPAILTFVYYRCGSICPLMLGGLATTFEKLDLKAGAAFQLITISIDETDTPAIARAKKKNYITAIGVPFPDNGWKFLTGSRSAIEAITEAAGFRYRRTGDEFIHPAVMIFLARGGTITNYVYAQKYLNGIPSPVILSPFEINTALAEAHQGTIRHEIRKTRPISFPPEPRKESEIIALLPAIGVVTLICLIVLFAFLVKTGRMAGSEDKRGT